MKKIVIIMGSAPCLMEDLFLLHKIVEFESCDFLAVGLDCATRYMGRIEHCATYHPEGLTEFRKRREEAGGNLDYIIHSHLDRSENEDKSITIYPVDRIWPFEAPSGSSAMLGVEVGIGLGYEKIIVAGCPLVDPEYAIEKNYRKGWTYHFDKIRNKVRSMSGWTRDLLGAPTVEWLNG